MNEKVELKELVTKLKDQSKNIERVLDDLRERRLKPVVHGKWEEDSDPGEEYGSHYKCTACGMRFGLTTDWIKLFKFCPNCGADMREEG